MAEILKDMFFTKSSIQSIAETIKRFYPDFDSEKFADLFFDETVKTKELKQKMRHATICLKKTLPDSYAAALKILKNAVPYIKGFEVMCLPDYVELYGMDDWDNSLPALALFTKYGSSEFAIRPFIIKDPVRTMKFINDLAEDKDPKVRRFASEGCRPRLPWAMALPGFKKDPFLILPVLEKLKDDESDFVRRSVANNLNDISKDHPDIVLDICEKWYGKSKNINEIVKHACRTMLKAGNKRALILFGFGDPDNIGIENFKLEKNEVYIGDKTGISFDLINKEEKAQKVRLEYAVYFVKAKGKTSKKVFQIIEKSYSPGKHTVTRKHSFIDMSTRKHYEGEHKMSIILNGVEMEKLSVFLKNK